MRPLSSGYDARLPILRRGFDTAVSAQSWLKPLKRFRSSLNENWRLKRFQRKKYGSETPAGRTPKNNQKEGESETP